MAAPSIELSKLAAQAVADGGAEPRWKGCAVNMPYRFRKALGIGDQSFGFWKPLNIDPLYFEYNSTMSCSFNWICTRSSRLGKL